MAKRRDFIRKVALGSAGLAIGGGRRWVSSASSYRRIIGANERIHVAVIGLNGRGSSMAGTFAGQPDAEVSCVCDVDTRTIPKALASVDQCQTSYDPAGGRRLPQADGR